MRRCGYVMAAFLAVCFLSSPATWAAASKAQGEQKWAATVAAAKKEGTVNIYSSWSAPARVALTKAFKDKYGINIQFTPFGRGAEFIAKYQAEKNAGLVMADVFGLGASTLLVGAKPRDFLGRMEPLLILPEVLDPKSWRNGSPFADKSKQTIAMSGNTMRFIGINTNLIKPGEITSYRDVLKPQYRGKVTMNDPSVSGAGLGMFGHLSFHIWSQEEATEYIKQVVKNGAEIMRDQRLQIEWLARGKNPIALALDPNGFAEMMRAGAPIAPVILKEGAYITTADGGLAVPKVPAHPNAAAVFVNWLLSREGQRVYCNPAGAMSMRTDVPVEGLNPGFVPGPDEKTFYDSEDYILKRGTLLKVAKKIFADK